MILPRVTAQAGRGLRLFAPSFERAGPHAAPWTGIIIAGRTTAAAAQRPFGASRALGKKRKIAAAANSPVRGGSSSSSSSSSSAEAEADEAEAEAGPGQDPLDIAAFVAAYEPIDAFFGARLQTALGGGRWNPAALAALPVTVKPDAAEAAAAAYTAGNGAAAAAPAAETFPLGELAQVVPRSARVISLLAHDRAYIKPILSAVQASADYNQQPQRAPDNELELLLRAEPERRDELARRVRDTVRAWRERVRQARARHERRLRVGLKRGLVLPDAAKRAADQLLKAQEKKMRQIDAAEAQAIARVDRTA